MSDRTDTERLNWLENEANGVGIVHDDNKFWAVACSGFQNVVHGDEPSDLQTTFMINASKFRLTVREAIDAAMDDDEYLDG